MQQLQRLDDRAFRAFRTFAHTPEREKAVRSFSRLGEHAALWMALGAAGTAVDTRRRGRWMGGAGVVAGTYVANQTIKLAVRRKRPEVADLPPLIPTPTKLSFPSAHSASSAAAAVAYAGLVPRPVLYPAAAAMALSRLYLGVHYPSDVAVGITLGIGLGALARR